MKVLEVIKVQAVRQHEIVQWEGNLISSYIVLWLLLLYITDKRDKKAMLLSHKIVTKVWSLGHSSKIIMLTWDFVSTTNLLSKILWMGLNKLCF